ncbi:hypothetical protein ACFO6W_23085 [Dysgonomonas termitidis]|uniref:Uncharacterized protein n=1 Tax=Dysgonomonas termitidis TaxID=1516126 RepID=A0ABV9L232_9BACT
MGISTYLSLRKTEFKFSSGTQFKILRRIFVIFFIGLALSWVEVFIGTYDSLTNESISIGNKL